MEIAEYAKSNKIDKDPEFAWWVPSALKCRKFMISKTDIRIRKQMKFVISIPVTYNEVVEIDRINGNTYWKDPIKK